ncbi:MAG: hypothetical protein RB288_11310 [Bacteroidales bacterium]|jgi:outer membrane murein-binding lipoprotein Lpp|nr:hypothetical protein [Bacteroidales bacterium]
MKTIKALILIMAVLSLTGCKYKTMSEQIEAEKQDLISQLAKSDSTMKEYLSVMSDADAKLSALLGQESGEQAATGELPARLERAIAEITASMEETEQKYQSARSRYYTVNARVKTLEEEVAELRVLAEQKDSLINVLNEKSAQLSSTIEEQTANIETLTGKNSEMEATISEMTGNLNTAWYVAGTKDELISGNVITKTGGFLGFLGRVMVLSPSLSSSSMEKIDIREKKTFPLKSTIDKLEFISIHPSGSYQLTTTDAETVTLTVTDPARFWEGSRYMVVVL